MKAAIIGGKLQGTEAVYLASKAGIRSLLIDKKKNTPASGLCDEFALFDVRKKEKALIELLKTADFVLPALENEEAHQALIEIAAEHHFKLAFDQDAYGITSSKLKSDELIRKNGVPAPGYYPDCKSPYIIKPSGESGSIGVRKAISAEEVEVFLSCWEGRGNWVVQEFLDGPSYSVEVIGVPGNYRAYQITKIHMDEVYDCKMVTSPCPVTQEQKDQFERIGCRLAELVKLHGIMDVEVIDDKGLFKVLEIDARIPSQTPTVVYHASGVNLLKELADLTVYGIFADPQKELGRCCSYEHYTVTPSGVFPHGEHIMGEAGPLTLRKGFCGADEVLSDYDGSWNEWRGTFINWADTESELEEKRNRMMRCLEGREWEPSKKE